MRVGYGFSGRQWTQLSKRLATAACLLLLPLGLKLQKAASAEVKPIGHALSGPSHTSPLLAQVATDPRTERLRCFFSSLHCPIFNMAEDFVHAADDNHLDWRLLPSISVIESSGGKAYRNNNIFGWGLGGPLPFPSIRAGLNMVAFKLGQSALYRDLDVPGKLRVYNPNANYPGKVMDVMNRISRVEELGSADSARLIQRQGEYVYRAD
jgi:hypothetical protein